MKDKEALIRYRERTAGLLRRAGLSLEWGSDFDRFKAIIADGVDRQAVAPGFDPACTRRPLDGIWLVARDGRGAVVHTQATRCVTVAPDMGTHLATALDEYEPAYWRFEMDRLALSLTSQAGAIAGPSVYHGEFWVKGGPSGVRGGAAMPLFSRLMLAAALERFDARHFYGFMVPINCLRGLPQKMCYTRCEQGSIRFDQDDGRDPIELWMTWMTAEEADHSLHIEPETFLRLMKPREVTEVAEVA